MIKWDSFIVRRTRDAPKIEDAVEWAMNREIESTHFHRITSSVTGIDSHATTTQFTSSKDNAIAPGKLFPAIDVLQTYPLKLDSSAFEISIYTEVPDYSKDICGHCRHPINGRPAPVPRVFLPSVLSTATVAYRVYANSKAGVGKTFVQNVDKTLCKLRELERACEILSMKKHNYYMENSIDYDQWFQNRHLYQSTATETQKRIPELVQCPPVRMSERQFMTCGFLPDTIFIPRNIYVCSHLCCSWNCAMSVAKSGNDIQIGKISIILHQLMRHLGQGVHYRIEHAPSWKQQTGVGTNGDLPNSVFREQYCKDVFLKIPELAEDIHMVLEKR